MIGLHIAGLPGLLISGPIDLNHSEFGSKNANDVLRVYTVGTTYKILREVFLNSA